MSHQWINPYLKFWSESEALELTAELKKLGYVQIMSALEQMLNYEFAKLYKFVQICPV